MSNIGEARKGLIRRILEGTARASSADRRAAFNLSGLAGPRGALVAKVAMHAHQISGTDIADARASGLSEDEVFEIVVCAAIGQANRQYDAAFGALEAAIGRE